jgi:hypothetical protein
VKGKGDLKTYFVNTEMSRSLSQSNVASWKWHTFWQEDCAFRKVPCTFWLQPFPSFWCMCSVPYSGAFAD